MTDAWCPALATHGSRRTVSFPILALVLASAPPARAQDPALTGDLAQLVALEDRREFDAAVLRRAAQHPDALVRARTAMAMGRIGDRGATGVLLTLLADVDTAAQTEAAFALGELGDTAAVEELARRLEAFPAATSAEVDLEVVTALAKIGGPVAARALEELLARHPPSGSDADGATGRALLEAWRLGRLAPGQRLADYVRAGGGEWRRNATYSAARLRASSAGAALLEAASAPDALTRSYAARALTPALADSAGLAREAFSGRLRSLVADDQAQVRINALRSLAAFRDSTLAGVAIGRLVDRDPNVPVQAAATLGALGGSRASTALAERFGQTGSFALRRAALLGLAQADGAAAVNAGAVWRADGEWRLRAAYAEMLGVARTADARGQLVQMLDDADARVAASALGTLAQLVPAGDAPLRVVARERLAHPDVMVRTAALEFLARERDPALVPDLVAAYRRAEREEMNDARLAAVAALAAIADRSPADRTRVEREFLERVPRSPDYLVRRAVADRLGQEAHARYWGDVYPVETGKSPEDYRELVRRYVLPGTQPRATIETERGAIVVELFARDAPMTVDNFLRLVERRFFDGHRWHRVVPNFVIQDGDPRGDGNGGPGMVIRDEINRRRYDRGVVGMALSGLDTGGSQFFITHSPQPHLDGGYTVFGRVVSGYEVLDQVVQGDRIRRIFR